MTDTPFQPHAEAETHAAPKVGRLRWGHLLVWAVLLGLLGMLAWKLSQSSLTQVSSGSAPNFTLTQFDGQTFHLNDQRGKVVVINFWASWCVPCRQEAPALEATWRTYRDRGVVLVGVDYLDTDAEARRYMAEFNNTYPNGPDMGTQIAAMYRIQGVPETYFVSPAGVLRGVIIGPTNEAELRQHIEVLLQE